MTAPSADFNERVARARTAGKTPDAAPLWRDLLLVTSVEEEDYSRCCQVLADIYRLPNVNRPLAAAAVLEYLGELDAAGALYASQRSVRDLARLQSARGQHAAAMEAYRSAGLLAHAARAATAGGMHAEARRLWLGFLRPADAASDRWLGALARFNAGRAALEEGDKTAAGTLLYEAMNLLGSEADAREAAGDRDGAFRCFLVMKDIGLRSRAFEDVAEGYLNMGRILRLKGDRFGTVQAFHDLIACAEEMGELHAAAELYREAGEYARRMGFVYSDHFLLNAGRAWSRVAQDAIRQKRPVGLVENALLAAVDAFNRTLDHTEVARCYQALAALELPTARQERYQALARELSALQSSASQRASRDDLPTLPEYFRRRFNLVDVAVRDLVEREASADVGAAAARLITNPQLFDVGRRRALNLFLQFDDHRVAHGPDEPLTPFLIAAVGEARNPSLVGPLMDIFRRGTLEQKVAAVKAASQMKAREAIALVDAALSAPVGTEVYLAGVTALRGLTFPQALDALVRLFGNHDDRRVREVALKNAALMGTSEAAEFLLDVLRTNTAQMGLLARSELTAHASEKMRGALENNRRVEANPEIRMFISQLLANMRRKDELG
jgi:hypothetical protein